MRYSDCGVYSNIWVANESITQASPYVIVLSPGIVKGTELSIYSIALFRVLGYCKHGIQRTISIMVSCSWCEIIEVKKVEKNVYFMFSCIRYLTYD